MAVIGCSLNYSSSPNVISFLDPSSFCIEMNMLNELVSCNLLLLLAVNGSVSHWISVLVMLSITHRVVLSRIIYNWCLASLLTGKFVPVIVRWSPPAGLISIYGETLVIMQSTTSAVTRGSVLTRPISSVTIGNHEPAGRSSARSQVIWSTVATMLLQSR